MDPLPIGIPKDISPTEWSKTPAAVRRLVEWLLAEQPEASQSVLATWAQIQLEKASMALVDRKIGTIGERAWLNVGRRQAEDALAASERRLRTIIESEPECVKVLATDGTILEINSAGLALLEADRLDQVVGHPVTDFLLPDHHLPFEAMGQRVLGGATERLEFSIQGLGGTQRWVDSHSVPLRNEQNEIVGILAITRDISERVRMDADRKQTEEALTASEQKLSTLISNLPGYVYRVKNDSEYTPDFISQGVEAITGYHPDEYLVAHTISCGKEIHPDDAQRVWDLVQQGVNNRLPYEFEYRVITKSGQAKWVWERGRGIYDADGTLLYLEGFVTDISSQKQAEVALRESEARYRLLAENTNDLVCLLSPARQFLYVSPSCTSLLGYHFDDMRGQLIDQFVHPDDRDRLRMEIQAAACETAPITYRMRHCQGHYLWFETLARPITDEAGQVVQLQTTSRDVTERVRAQLQLQHEALYDGLTGLANRHQLMERLDQALQRTREDQRYQFGLLFLDLDRFKVINDSLGHLTGDQMLVAIAAKLRATLGDIDLAARLGGDEFVVLLDDLETIDGAVAAAERIFAALSTPFPVAGREVYTTVSIGIVVGHRGYGQAEHLLRDADIAMYRAKAKGKARYEIFNVHMHTQAVARLHLENDLRCAIETGQMVLYYQPIVELATGKIVGFEALTRWQHPVHGLVSPGEFIPLAEEIGLICRLDSWALAIACQQLATWKQEFPDLEFLSVSVNLSAQDLRQTDLLAEIDRVLATTGLAGSSLTLEITESMLIEDIEATIDLLGQLKSRGVQISIDDFGTGYSSLSYLHQLPLDYLKVDQSFVGQLRANQPGRSLVATIMALGTQLGLETIAEGIETTYQLNQLRQLGYSLGQGHLFSPALDTARATARLARQTDDNLP